MDIAQTARVVTDIETELLAAYPTLARRLALVLRNASEAEDVAQAAFVRALENRNRFTGGDVRSWFYTIGLRLAFNELRRRKRTAAWNPHDEPSWATSTDPDLWIALGHLEPRQRAALLLSALEGYTHPEIGQILGVPAGTVSSWLSRTKEQLRRQLGDQT